jgi:hypothetical protein
MMQEDFYASLLEAPSLTKNQKKERYPEMRLMTAFDGISAPKIAGIGGNSPDSRPSRPSF